MITDSFYSIGSGHKVCQDFAFHDKTGAVLSDGCSSGGDTGTGARIIALAKDKNAAMSAYHSLGLKKEDMYATKISLGVDGVSAIIGDIYGDGTIVYKFDRAESFLIYDVTYSQNAPQYPSYEWFDELKQYQEEFKDQKRTCQLTYYDLSWKSVHLQEEVADEYPYKTWGSAKHGFAFSDGLHSFVDDKGTPINYIEILKELTAFKGEFNKTSFRRRWFACQKEFAKRGWKHYDDLSGIMVAI